MFAIPNSCHAPQSNTLKGRAVKIVDGDTFDLLTTDNVTVRIRLHGIDCPERKQHFFQVAKHRLGDLLIDKTIRAVKMDTDRYKRTIAMVFVDELNVNEEMIRSGLAWHFKKYDQNPVWAELERQAAANKIGLWSQPDPVAPWEFRHR